ncbi:hypothetical protein M514_04397 [Trichuris suis]|uniref:TraB family protein n=1 Tax=Trichuris suis TaxID=68888 RepID=A0A085N4G8_9BILA|nr:hypothetical protein M514_04397 [Trichuris suis]
MVTELLFRRGEAFLSEEQADLDSDVTTLGRELNGTLLFTRTEKENGLPATVTTLDCSYIPSNDKSGPLVHIGHIYLIGTAHFSLESQEDVRKVMRMVQPNAVMVELCANRAVMLELDSNNLLAEASQMSFFGLLRNMRTKVLLPSSYGMAHGFLQAALLSMSAHFTRELGMTPGGEFRVALEESQKIKDCSFHLGDRPVNITLRRAVANLSFWHRLKFFISMIATLNSKITEKEIERLKESDMLEELLHEISCEFPSLAKVLLEERDQYMAFMLQYLALEEFHRVVTTETLPAPFKIVGSTSKSETSDFAVHRYLRCYWPVFLWNISTCKIVEVVISNARLRKQEAFIVDPEMATDIESLLSANLMACWLDKVFTIQGLTLTFYFALAPQTSTIEL